MIDHRFVMALVVASLLPMGAPRAQTESPAPSPPLVQPRKPAGDRNDRRLFVRFVEDAAVSTGGWAELQYRYDNLSDGSSHFLGPNVAFKIVNDVEAGLRFGWEDVNPDSGPNESGLSDVDLYAKYRLPGGRVRTAVGTLLKLATADEKKGLGTGKEDLEFFAAWRADLEAVSLAANAGVRFNGNPDAPLPSSKNSFLLGGSILLPASQRLTIVIEGSLETERFERAKDDARLTLGFQSRTRKGRGGFRGGVSFPLSDGAPDYQLLGGAFLTY